MCSFQYVLYQSLLVALIKREIPFDCIYMSLIEHKGIQAFHFFFSADKSNGKHILGIALRNPAIEFYCY